VPLLQRQQFPLQPVILRIGDFGRRLLEIEFVVMRDLGPQLLDAV
jgi:hypothetical protein